MKSWFWGKKGDQVWWKGKPPSKPAQKPTPPPKPAPKPSAPTTPPPPVVEPKANTDVVSVVATSEVLGMFERILMAIFQQGDTIMTVIERLSAAIEGIRGDMARKDAQLASAEARVQEAVARALEANAAADLARAETAAAREEMAGLYARLDDVVAAAEGLDKENEPDVPTEDPGISTGGVVD